MIVIGLIMNSSAAILFTKTTIKTVSQIFDSFRWDFSSGYDK